MCETAPARRPPSTFAALAATCVLLAGWACTRPSPGPPPPSRAASRPAEFALVRQRDFVDTLRVHGTVEAVRSWLVAAPRLAGAASGSLVVTRLAAAGSRVKRGDLLVEFDRQAQIKAAQDRRFEYLDLVAQIRRKQADQEAAREKDQTELIRAAHDVERARLELLKNEMVSRIVAEKNEQALEEATATLRQLRETFDLKRKAASAELRILEIQRDRALSSASHAEANAAKMTILSELDGLVVLRTTWKGGQMSEVQEGEEVRPGTTILEVVSRSGMQVRARINQADGQRVRPGLPASLRLDAYPDLVLSGRLEQLTPVAGVSSLSPKVRFFVAVVSVAVDDARLMPDLSVAVDFELERQPAALVVPRDALARDGGRWFVEMPGGRRQEIVLGRFNDSEAVVRTGLREGDRVARHLAARSGAAGPVAGS